MTRTTALLRCVTHRRTVSSLLAAPLVLTGLFLVGTGVAGFPTSAGPGDAVRTLRDADSLSVEATLQFISFDARTHDTATADGYPSFGTYSYRALDSAWYAKSMLDPSRFVGMDNEVAFDGEVTFVARSSGSEVSVSHAGEPRSLGMTLPNPLFALASWAIPVGDRNLDAAVKLSDLRSLDDAVLSLPDTAWTSMSVGTTVYEVARVRGDVLYGVPYTHEIVVPLGQRAEPCRIDRVGTNGQLITRFEFESWQPVDANEPAVGTEQGADQASSPSVRLPRVIRLSEYSTTNGQPVHTAVFFMESIRVNPALDAADLTIAIPTHQVVWNSDLEEFVGP